MGNQRKGLVHKGQCSEDASPKDKEAQRSKSIVQIIKTGEHTQAVAGEPDLQVHTAAAVTITRRTDVEQDR